MRRLVLFLACVSALPAQTKQTENTIRLDAGASPAKASIKEAAWVAGQWQGAGISGPAEEVWTQPHAGVMLGVFRQLRPDSVHFYEILNIVEHEGSLVLRLKHFHPDLKGWEEKDMVREFRLVRSDDRGLWFDGISMLRNGKDGMLATVAIKGKDGQTTEGRFEYKRVGSLQPIRP